MPYKDPKSPRAKASLARRAKKYFATAKGRTARDSANRRGGAAHTRKRRAWLLSMYRAFKLKPCADCGGTFDPVCMDFDHRLGEVKLFTIGNSNGARSVESILGEIAKCDVVCANCHRIRTFRNRNHADTCAKRLPIIDATPSQCVLPLSGERQTR